MTFKPPHAIRFAAVALPLSLVTAAKDPTNTVPGNKTAREQGFARLLKLLNGM
jgi:hypothetical protein